METQKELSVTKGRLYFEVFNYLSNNCRFRKLSPELERSSFLAQVCASSSVLCCYDIGRI